MNATNCRYMDPISLCVPPHFLKFVFQMGDYMHDIASSEYMCCQECGKNVDNYERWASKGMTK